MFEESLSFALALVVDFVNANFFIPRCDSQVVSGRREAEIGDTILWGLVQGNIF